MDTYKQVTPACILGCAALHISCALARSEHVVQQPQGREIIRTAWRIDDLSVMNGLTLRKAAVGGSEFTREQGHPRQPLSNSLSYSPRTPPHCRLHHRWHYFLRWIHISPLETFNAPLFFPRPLGLYFPYCASAEVSVLKYMHLF